MTYALQQHGSVTMPPTDGSDESRQFADQAITASLIGMISMAAETGNPMIVRVQYRMEAGTLATSPYAVYSGQDDDRLFLLTGQSDAETLAIPKSAIVQVRVVRPSEVVRSLNAAAPLLALSQLWCATFAYYQESYRQWDHVLSAFQRMAR